MYRIDSDGSIAGAFSDGNPQTGQQATIVSAAYMTELQETLARAIELAGIALVKGNTHQLYDAIVAIAQGTAGVGTGPGSVPTSRLLGVGGLVTGGGSLAGDRTFSVAAATTDDIVAGTRTDAAITPAGLAAASSSGGSGDDGWDRLPSGRILQFGGVRAVASEGIVSGVFPREFPNRCRRIFFTAANETGSNSRDISVQRVSVTKTGFTAFYQWSASPGSANSIDGLDYFAIGD